jgi:S1-C subfamily serine protease
MRHLLVVAAIVLGGADAMADDLAARYEKLSRAVVRIETALGGGTGFFINSTGRMVTAAHVVFDRSFIGSSTQFALKLAPRWPASAVFHDGIKKPLPNLNLSQIDVENAAFDLAVVETGLASPDYLPIGKAAPIKVGNRVIAIGFPGSANSGVLYEAFISSKHTSVPTVRCRTAGRTFILLWHRLC